MKVWLDGKLVDKSDARISVYDHCLLYGDGVFEGIRVYGGSIFECEAHVERLFASAGRIRLEIPYTREQITDAMYETLRANKKDEAYIRLVVTRGVGTLGLDPKKCPTPSVFIIADSITLYPQEMYDNGMAVIIARTTRTAPTMLNPTVKSCNYLNNIMAKIEAIDAGVPEAIMLNHQGNIAECTGDNIFIVSDGKVYTPDETSGILMGITRGVAIRLCEHLGIELEERPISVGELVKADECFLTGTAAEVIAVTSVDGQQIGNGKPGPVTQKLLGAFRDHIAAEVAGDARAG